jgi:hypothetical protein
LLDCSSSSQSALCSAASTLAIGRF